MLFVKGGVINLVKGDDETLPVNLKDANGNAYIMAAGDRLVLTVKESYDSTAALFTIDSSSTQIDIARSDTVNLEPGKYVADIELVTATGKHRTVWPDWSTLAESVRKSPTSYTNFILLPEVTV